MNPYEAFAITHELAHTAPDDVEDTLTLALTHRDCWLLLFMIFVTNESFPCLKPEMLSLHSRFYECLHIQKPDWGIEDELSSEGS